MKKMIPITLMTMGTVLIIISIISTVNPRLFSVAPPEPLTSNSSFPFNGYIGTLSDFTEINIYARDDDGIASIIYYDTYVTNGVELVRAVNVTKNYIWIPDVNKDGSVDDIDLDLVNKAWGTAEGDPNYNPDADVNNDGVVDTDDAVLVGIYYKTQIFVGVHPNPQIGTASFIFKMTDTLGSTSTYGGEYTITASITPLEGKWYVDNNEVSEGQYISINTTRAKVKFVKTSTQADSEISCYAIIDEMNTTIPYKGNGVWEGTLEITQLTTVKLIATTSDSQNFVTITIAPAEIPPQPKINIVAFSTGITGAVLLGLGILTFVSRKTR
jgi:hypothetical protein